MSIEQKISELLEDSKKLEAEQIAEETTEVVADEATEEEVVAEANVVTKNAPPQDPMPEIDAEEDDEEENQDNKKAADAKNDEVKTSKSSNVANAKASAPEGMNKMKEDVDALLNGEETLSEEFRAKAETIFEAAVMSRVNAEVEKLDEAFEQKLAEATEEIHEGLVEKVDGYLGLMVEQWMEQNALALESGMKSEILESFVNGLKNVFEEHYIDIPEEKFDVLGDMESKVEDLESKLNESVAASVDLKKELDQMKREKMVEESAEGLSDTESEKFHALAEELSYEDVDSFGTKLQTIRENYFGNGKANADVKSVVTDEPVAEEKVLSESMSRYTSALGKTTF